MKVKYSWTNNNINLSLGTLWWWWEYGECNNYVSESDCEINLWTNTLQRINLYNSDTMWAIVEKVEFYY